MLLIGLDCREEGSALSAMGVSWTEETVVELPLFVLHPML